MSECPSWHPHPNDYILAVGWARDLLLRKDWVILDTETTGLDGEAEAVQIAMVSPEGEVLFSSLLRPAGPIPPDASRVNGITDEMVATAPTFPEVRDQLERLLAGRQVVIYNADFDDRILRQSARRYGVAPLALPTTCAMNWYATYYGDWSDWHGSYRWQKLPHNGSHQAHDAAGDCLAVLDLIKKMAGVLVQPVAKRVEV